MKSIALRVVGLLIFLASFIILIQYAKGWRINIRKGKIGPTGIIAIHSSPEAAKVFINGSLKGVTNINLTLPPQRYHILLKKDGYTEWGKTVNLKKETVLSFNALLFPKNPSLSPLTNIGISKAISIDQTGKILIISRKGDEKKDGLYIFETNHAPISFNNSVKPILYFKDLPFVVQNTDVKNLKINFSPEFDQAIIEIKDRQFLISLTEENKKLFEVTQSSQTLLDAWQKEREEKIRKILETFPKGFPKIASPSFKIIAFSPDKTKILYQAKESIVLPKLIKKKLIGTNQTPEKREIKKGEIYIYDKREDKNFLIEKLGKPVRTFRWYPDSLHIVTIDSNSVEVEEYDGTNKTIVYSGPFKKNFFDLTDNGKLVVLANLNPSTNLLPDLYLVGIR